MDVIHIKASHPQLLKLRKGQKVRVKPAMKGEGIPLIVVPSTFSQHSKSFASNRGMDISLTPNEILQNKEQQAHPEIQGQGIFGKRFDRFVRKTVGKTAQDVIYKGADKLKPTLINAISKVGDYIPQAGEQIGFAVANASGHSELAPMAGELGKRAGTAVKQEGMQRLTNYLDNPHGRGINPSTHLAHHRHPHLHYNHEVGILGIGGTRLHRQHAGRLSNPYLEHKLQNKELPIQFQRLHHTAGNGLGLGLYL